MSCVPRRSINPETQRMVLQSIVEEALGDIEAAYAAKDLEGLMSFLDKDFEARSRFQSVLESYFVSVNRPHLHFVIDMIIADKNGVNVRLHWFRKSLTLLNVTIKPRGSSQLLFKRYPEGLKLKRIDKQNPFF
ncbi:MAG: nuclear transport factor 2 family protein [Candidatus Omnitrophota bacterium]|nr:nuclear transport factor 2 family protein [Candidatus Omnitrophota bacterium]